MTSPVSISMPSPITIKEESELTEWYDLVIVGPLMMTPSRPTGGAIILLRTGLTGSSKVVHDYNWWNTCVL